MDTRAKGRIGENEACSFIEREGFVVKERNYQKKWGEIDIIATKGHVIHFFEVKSITVPSIDSLEHEYRPEENVHGLKVRNIRRMVETYLFEQGGGDGQEFSFHVLCVFRETKTGRVVIRWIKDIIL
ncbi:MAG: YraN family protein [Patescibacteria group bacterium]